MFIVKIVVILLRLTAAEKSLTVEAVTLLIGLLMGISAQAF